LLIEGKDPVTLVSAWNLEIFNVKMLKDASPEISQLGQASFSAVIAGRCWRCCSRVDKFWLLIG
jgi:hypothetical protein